MYPTKKGNMMTKSKQGLLLAASLVLAGCAAAGTGAGLPTVSFVPGGNGGGASLTVPVNFVTPVKSGYHVSYVQSDVQDYAIGIFDAQSSPATYGTTELFLGKYFVSNGTAFTTTNGSVAFGSPDTPTYMDVLAGTSGGTLGLLTNLNAGTAEVNGTSGSALASTDLRTAKRWMVVERDVALTGSSGEAVNTTFGNLEPGTGRYYLIAVAFLKTGAATQSDVAGYAETTSPLTITANTNTTLPSPLNVVLNYGLGSASASTTVTDATPSATVI